MRAMTQRFEIPGTLPSLNEIIDAAKVRSGSWSKYADVKHDTTGLCGMYARLAGLKPVTGAAHFSFEWHCRSRRKDPDNISAGAKFILDALVREKVLKNDGWGQVESIEHTFHKAKEDKIIITIRETT